MDSLLAEDVHFSSPIDNALDRATYLERCWPNSKLMDAFDYIYQAEEGGTRLHCLRGTNLSATARCIRCAAKNSLPLRFALAGIFRIWRLKAASSKTTDVATPDTSMWNHQHQADHATMGISLITSTRELATSAVTGTDGTPSHWKYTIDSSNLYRGSGPHLGGGRGD